ncbi:multicopper oxidase family protein [Paeniglutamicibacter cryotolerans]|uniref:FtsP/CotA-like multicopper oxidase with cupredoxin domain n=1 Tax=Paeniglutamicibacter cryotolerans TaxID=670079 RepID=A0A839QS79_9MICC|nr:multicopper oxidase family protein [Paeniglutamicibacter cryotolerans]MBB2997634.1 FtsP/CotA-like multicopper oxidase with cupredoxin domain [Paeniglutamicibacter cryotolerans]
MTHQLNRRSFLGLSVATTAVAALAACTPTPPVTTGTARILPTDPLVTAYETQRASTGKTVSHALTARSFSTTLAGKNITTWGYDGSLVAPTLRGMAGDQLNLTIANQLPESTSIHWHGLALRNDADGVPGLTQEGVGTGKDYPYDFKLPHPGTYWYHSHVEMQRERALYGALVIDDPQEPLKYDKEWVIVLDDWLDGITGTPDEVLKELSEGMGGMGGMNHGRGDGGMVMGHMLMGATSDFLGVDAGDVAYPFHLFNGREPGNPEIFTAKKGERIRLRIINAAGDTAYRIGVPNQKLTVTHTDGFPVQHIEVDAVVLGMGERIDALLTVRDGHTPVVALAEGKAQMAYGLLSTGTGTPPARGSLPKTLTGKVVDGGQLTADPAVSLATKTPDRVHELRLTGGMANYDWGINGHRFDMAKPFENAFDIKAGERVEMKFVNDTEMWHPMHIHGHTFQVGDTGARKDTIIVRPKETIIVRFDADNPGQWLFHCHNAYHAERGMMGVFSYVK